MDLLPVICPPQQIAPLESPQDEERGPLDPPISGNRFVRLWWIFFNNLANAVKSLLGATNVVDFGAVGDAVRGDDGAITTATKAFVSATAFFGRGDVGKSIVIVGAGVAGATLVTKIAAVTSAHSITLLQAASTTVATARFVYGTDNTAAFQSAVDSITSGRQRTISIPRATGGYLTVGTLSIGTGRPSFQLGGSTWYAAATIFDVTENTPAFPPLVDGGCPSIVGDGVQTSKVVYCIDTGNLIEQTQVNGSSHSGYTAEALALVNTATTFNLTTNYNLRLVNLQISGFNVGINLNGTNAVSGYGRGSWFYLSNLFVNDFLSAGLMTSHAVEVMQVNTQYYAVVNNPTLAWGIIIDTDTSGISCKSVICSFCGMVIRNTMSSTAVWDRPPEFIFGDEVVVDTMPSYGIWFHSTLAADGLGRAGKSYHFVDSWSSFSTVDGKDGILIEAGEDISFTDLRVRDCRRDGIRITGGNYIRLVNITCLGNNFQNVGNGAGVSLWGPTTGYVTIIGGLFGDNIAGEGSGFQKWGIFVDSTYTSPHAFQGMVYDNNATGPISDNSPASYQQHFGFTSVRTSGGFPVAVLHKMYFPKGRLEVGDGACYVDFMNDLANATALVLGTNRFIRFLRSGQVLLIKSGTGAAGDEVQIDSLLLRTEKIRSQQECGFNVDPEAGFDVKTNVIKIVTQARLTFLAGAATLPVKASTAGDLSAAAINLASSNEVTGNLPVGNLGSGSGASSSTFWRGDGTWSGSTTGMTTAVTLVTSVGGTTNNFNLSGGGSAAAYVTISTTTVTMNFTNGLWTS